LKNTKQNKIISKVEINFIKLKKTDGTFFIQLLKEHFNNELIINHKYKTLYEDRYVLFPLVLNEGTIEKLIKLIGNLINISFTSKFADENPKFKYRSLKEALVLKIPDNFTHLIPNSYDIIGKIAILEFEKLLNKDIKEIDKYKKLVADAVIEVNKNVKSVFEKKSEIQGTHRLRKFAHLAGENNSETSYKENNCIFRVDIKTVYFSPRMVYERRRVSESSIQEKEVIIDMFAGVGPFSIQIARLNAVKIYAFDINPYAIKLLQVNIDTNKLYGEIFPYNLNVYEILKPSNQIGKKLSYTADRIIMNLPEQSLKFINVVCFLMKKSGGILHFYQISEKPNPIEKTIKDLKKKLIEFNWVTDKIFNSKIVKSYSPKADLVVVDLKIKYIGS